MKISDLEMQVLRASIEKCKSGAYKPCSFEEKMFLETHLTAAVKSVFALHKIHAHTPVVTVAFREDEVAIMLDRNTLELANKLGIR